MRTPRNDTLVSDIAAPPRTPAARRGTTDASGGPERRCVLSGRHDARDALIRLAVAPDGAVLPDVHARAPGRGAWLGVTRRECDAAVAKGRLKGALARAFKGAAIQIPDDLGARIEAALVRALTERLGIELRAGHVVLGTERIATAARSGTVRLLLHAADAGADGAGKLAQAWRVGEMAEGSGMKGTILPLDRATLSVALGRDNVVHLALTDPGAATRVASLAARLAHFQGPAPAHEAPVAPASGNDDILTKGE